MSVLPSVIKNFRGGTSLNTSVSCYEDLALRVKHQLGYPLVNIEIADEAIYDNISNAIEYFTKYTGYTEEFMVFDTKKYIVGVGIDMGTLINSTPEMYSSMMSGLSTAFDYDLNLYRKVVDIFSFDQSESTGINTLFTLEQAMSQQIYSSYMIGNFGFDLTSWQVLKGWIDTRKRVLAQTPHFRFDNRTQILRIIPEPLPSQTYLGLVGCYLERPIRDLVRESWVGKMSLALTKISCGFVREKYSSTTMFGGGNVSSSMLAQGLSEKDALEKELVTTHQDTTPPLFFLGLLMSMLSIGSLLLSTIS